MQAKRIQVNEADIGVNAVVSVRLVVPSDPREEVNFHNIWGGVSGEPQDAGANAQYTWVLFIQKAGATVTPVFIDTQIDNETFNADIIACGVGSGANESPFNVPPIQIKTSRTIEAGDSLVLQIVTTGITAGLSSNRVMLCAHTTRK